MQATWEHLKTWWPTHTAWIWAVANFLMPSLQAFVSQHPKSVTVATAITIIIAHNSTAPADSSIVKQVAGKIGALLLAGALVLGLTACPKSTVVKLATASDAFATAMVNAQKAIKLGVQDRVISPAEDAAIEPYLARVGAAGLILDKDIRASASNATISQDLQTALQAMSALTTSGVAGIKNPAKQQEIAVILQGASTALSVVAATVGS